jgi:hypothetical protein
VITDGLGLNITVMSYNGDLNIGIVADRDVIPDVGSMIQSLKDELATLMVTNGTAEVATHARPRRRRVRATAPRSL